MDICIKQIYKWLFQNFSSWSQTSVFSMVTNVLVTKGGHKRSGHKRPGHKRPGHKRPGHKRLGGFFFVITEVAIAFYIFGF